MNPNWVQDASFQVCVEECGQKCCNNPALVLPLTHNEALAHFKGDGNTMFRTKVTVVDDPKIWRTSESHRVYYLFDDQPGGRCMHTTPTGCDIYEDRPQACRTFPSAPTPGCLLWPVLETSPSA